MKKKKIEIFLVILLVILLGLLVIFRFGLKNKPSEKCLADEKIFSIQTEIKLSERQARSFQRIKKELCQDPDNYQALFDLARLKQDLLDFDGAVSLYQELRKRKPKDIAVLNNLGALYYNSKKYKKAEEMYQAILKITPKWMPAYTELVNIYRYHLTEKKKEIEPLLLNGLEKYPEMKQGFIAKLAVYYDEIVPNKSKAIEYYKKLLQLDPQNTTAAQRLEELTHQ